jgi:hypothetical protein
MKPCEEPGKASVEEGVIVLDGPDGVAVTMTAAAAEGTADSLLQAAAQIRKEQHARDEKPR